VKHTPIHDTNKNPKLPIRLKKCGLVLSDIGIKDEEVTWKVLGITVNGTITAPNDERLHPVVVFVAGSGPTDRNWCSPLLPGANGSAKLLAEKLASRGFVTLRYDKIASGPNVRENLPKFSGKISMQTHMQELSGAVDTILARKDVDGDKLFALTNSEGAIHAVNYQLQSKRNHFEGLVLTGAPGRSIGDVARTQFLSQSRSFPNGEVLMKHYDEAIAEFLAARPIVPDPALPREMKPFFNALENPANLPFSRELWTYNLSDYVSKIKDPILIVIGKKDIQVDWQMDGKALEAALRQNARASFAYPEDANHVLKHEELPKEKLTAEYVGAHYNAQEAVLDAEAAKIIFEWLNKFSS
jgi:uncharacterized protein